MWGLQDNFMEKAKPLMKNVGKTNLNPGFRWNVSWLVSWLNVKVYYKTVEGFKRS